jgi:hypothetical protein
MDDLTDLNLRWITPRQMKSLPPLCYLLDGLIPRGGLAMLYGRSGAGKTFLALDWAAQVARRDGVMYLVTEGQGGFPRRIAAWEAYYASPMSLGARFAFQAIDLLSETQVDGLLQDAAHIRPGLIVFDTLVNCVPGADENSARDMSLAIRACQRVIGETGAALLLIHHKTKSGGWERGSSVLRAAMDVMVEIAEEDGLYTVSCAKAKDAAPFPDAQYRLQAAAESCVLVPTNRAEWREHHQPLSAIDLEILGIMAEARVAERGIRVPDIGERIPTVTERTLYRVLRTLKGRGLADQEKERAPYRITEKGRALLRAWGNGHT